MNKKLFTKLVFGFLFCMCMLFTQKDTVQASIYLDMENTTITDENAVVSAMVYTGKAPMDSITIKVKKNEEEIKTLKREVNTHEDTLYTFDFQKDLGITLERDCLYEYTISQQMPFTDDDYAMGQFYTGDETYVTIYTVLVRDFDKPDEEYGVIGVECILDVTPGESYHYIAEENPLGHENYWKEDPNCMDGVKLPEEYVLEVISENPSQNIIRNQYAYSELPTGVWINGGYYIKDADTKEKIGKNWFWCPIDCNKVYVPEDVIEIDGQKYMYDAKTTNIEIFVEHGRPFYQNVYDVYYKKCDATTTQTSVTVNYVNIKTGKLIKKKTISNLTVGESYTYIPDTTCLEKKYTYIYDAENMNNVLSIDKLWTNPANNILTVYYKEVSSGAEQTENPEKVINPLKKEKPVIKIISKKKKTAVKLKFSKVKKAQGYEICYSTKKSFKNAKTMQVKNTKVVLKNLKKGKRYYMKIRGYRNVDGIVFYSKYSNIKKIKI